MVLFSGDGAGVADPMMRERRERRVEKERGRGCVCAGGKRKKMKMTLCNMIYQSL